MKYFCPRSIMILTLSVAIFMPLQSGYAQTETWQDYTQMFTRRGWQWYNTSGGFAGQAAWNPTSSFESEIGYFDPATCGNFDRPINFEYFQKDGDWVVFDGYGSVDCQGNNPTYLPQRMTWQQIGTYSPFTGCTNWTNLDLGPSGREKYAKWSVSGGAYCLQGEGYVGSPGQNVFYHRLIYYEWGGAACSNAYFTGRTCIKLNDEWHSGGISAPADFLRDEWMAKDLGRFFVINDYLYGWTTYGRYYWNY